MGYSNIGQKHESERIRELEAELNRERKARQDETHHVEPPPPSPEQPTVTIEKTSKALKKQLLSSWIVLIVGIFVVLGGGSGIGSLMIVVGIVAVIASKIQIWWRHG